MLFRCGYILNGENPEHGQGVSSSARVRAFQASYSSYAHHIAHRKGYHTAANHAGHMQSRRIQHARSQRY
ncbi:hypothetical protein JTE90_005858 [Oedothorax gibbosus]|uniref:Uncharacterized protein n=1 Tax=Oedothorax gibbosus TaxID=931172 RepID=A0AAV6URY7_9ARAC|nr:hypothetical protein JTE90_005858 [Oedothorax gibbosus]